MRKDCLIGESDAFLSTLDHASQLATIDRPILILGERGTGKELIAQRLHFLSKRWDEPLVSLNCAALSSGTLDSELFGHDAGSFTGAKQRHQGRFERANGGSLFLDELGTAPLTVQEKLLRVIEYGEYERVGGSHTLKADVRLICATNQNPQDLVVEKKFRADLLDRLSFDVIHLPPLRYREQDVLLLAEHFAIKMCQEMNLRYFAGFSYYAQQQILDYDWPGNVRELRNCIERAVFKHNHEEAQIESIQLNPFLSPWEDSQLTSSPSAILNAQKREEQAISLPLNLKQFQIEQEKALLEQALLKSQHHQRKAAEELGITYHQFRGLLKKHQLLTTIKG
ncbi:phage shock protein operon transcriptional activator [Aliivibrio sp. S3MY1]|uniref:phage shock protein operon transcriptional activator n=1 Tax=unclassified Aliivibrio TaxID=2645654 RepID=UPI00237890D1|nr:MULTISPECIES: phage shock protein operon transcriptional activator [unclassified Aliivibrio]MDD9194333.1 phage shock protein operon transcriptional activator [Aliivibrio sp. S3MY1]MDD9198001.1 phage shock protein operon transcriptional activator [Aliivibrio sp. S2MY1]